jgi:hypothetical protein
MNLSYPDIKPDIVSGYAIPLKTQCLRRKMSSLTESTVEEAALSWFEELG